MTKRLGEWLEAAKIVAEIVIVVATAASTVNHAFSDKDRRSTY